MITSNREDSGMEPSPLLIFPCNGNAREAVDALGDEFHLLGFVDDEPVKSWPSAWELGPWAVMDRSGLSRHPRAHVLAVPGSEKSYLQRRAVIESLGIADDRWATVIHPRASVSPRATIGRNVLVMAGAVICADAVVGDHVVVLPQAVIHHDCQVGDFTLVCSGTVLAGGVHVGRNCYLGSRTSVRPSLRIGDGALTGMGSVVLGDVPESFRVAGIPARPLIRRGLQT